MNAHYYLYTWFVKNYIKETGKIVETIKKLNVSTKILCTLGFGILLDTYSPTL